MTSGLRVLNTALLRVLGDQLHVGFSVFRRSGEVLFCNPAARRLYYGTDVFDPVGMSIATIEGDEFSAELLPIIHRICDTKAPLTIDHIRFGRRVTSVGWPIRSSENVPSETSDAVLSMATLTGCGEPKDWGMVALESSLASWGILESLTARELEVLAAIGRGLSQKAIGAELGITRKTVETHRARVGQKLNAKSSTELARIACESGIRATDVRLKRHTNQQWMRVASAELGVDQSGADSVNEAQTLPPRQSLADIAEDSTPAPWDVLKDV